MSAATNRSTISRQRLALQRVRAARGLSITSPEGTPTKSRPLDGAMSPPQEMRVKLLPRIAEYRSKGWINAEEESDYHQLLSSRKEFGDTTDQIALQVQKALDLAKVSNEKKQSTATGNNSRSLFRKPATGVGGELTLQKKLSYRRKSRLGLASPEPDTKKDVDKSSRRGTVESAELSIVEAMFGKDAKSQSERKGEKADDDAPSPSDLRKERLARARHRRNSSISRSPDAAKRKDVKEVVNEQQKADHTSTKTSIELSKLRRNLNVSRSPDVAKDKDVKEVVTEQHTADHESAKTSIELSKLRRNLSVSRSPDVAKGKDVKEVVTEQHTADHESAKTSIELSKLRRNLSVSRSPDVAKGKDVKEVVTEQHTADHKSAITSIELSKLRGNLSVSPSPDVAKGKDVKEVVTEQHTANHKLAKTSIELPLRASQKVLKRSPSLSKQVARNQNENSDTGAQQVLGGAPCLSESSSNEQQENVGTGNTKVYHQPLTNTSHPRPQVLKEAPTMTEAKLESANNSRGEQHICEPRELWQKNGLQTEEALKDLFVEMAFFARLGFIQPPSCLHCVYRESMEKTSPNLRCERYVPWRKNANVPIHPHELDGNIILVQCHAARSLVEGKGVQTYHWDKIKRQLICK